MIRNGIDLNIILTILKIMGIILLILLALVVVLASLVLFVPIRYQLQLHKNEDVNAKAKISYLFHIIHLSFEYCEKKATGKLRVFGIAVYDFFPSEEVKKKRQEKEHKKELKKEEKRKKKAKNQKKRKKRKVTPNKTKNKVSKCTNIENIENEKTEKIKIDESDCQNRKHKQIEERIEEQINEQINDQMEKMHIYDKVKLFFEKAVDKVKNIKYTISNFINKLKKGKTIFLWYVDLLSKEESKRAISKAKHQLRRLGNHIKPQVFQGNVQFGFEDPATTGDVFSKICMLYPFYFNHVIVVPNFEEQVFKGNLIMKGRIRMIVLLHIAWKVAFDDEIRKIYELCSNPDV